jgi:NADH-quinone oxidoreductase subunit L
MGMFTLVWVFGSLSFDEVLPAFAHAGNAIPEWAVWAVTLFFLLGVTGKSAQLPLYVWLPDAMAGPTPVSALIHAATMVTAGVYLIARSAPIFAYSHDVQYFVALVGGLTALFAATIAVAQFDIKKVLAYSTVSQLGFMVAAVGMGATVAGMFHLVTHAFFKALLFLGSGSVILAVERGHHPLELDGAHGHNDHHSDHHSDDHSHAFDPQDMRNMGGLRKQLPWTFWTYIMGTLALAGIPIFAGFWSKDEILLDASHENPLVYWLLVVAAFFTAFYMGRQVWLVFFGESRTHAATQAKESPWSMLIPLITLAVLSVIGGFMNFPFGEGAFSHRFGHWIGYTLEHATGHELHVLGFDWSIAGLSTLLALIAIGLSWLVYGRDPRKTVDEPDPLAVAGPLFNLLHNKYNVDEIYQFLIIDRYKDLARFLAQWLDWKVWHDGFHDTVLGRGFRRLTRFLADPVDKGVIDGLALGLASAIQGGASLLSVLQTGFVRNYALSVFLGVVLILGYLVFK